MRCVYGQDGQGDYAALLCALLSLPPPSPRFEIPLPERRRIVISLGRKMKRQIPAPSCAPNIDSAFLYVMYKLPVRPGAMIFSEMQLLIAIIRDETDKSDRKQNTSMPFLFTTHIKASVASIENTRNFCLKTEISVYKITNIARRILKYRPILVPILIHSRFWRACSKK